MDAGIRGMHLAYELLDGYDALMLVDAMAHGEVPGTVSIFEREWRRGGSQRVRANAATHTTWIRIRARAARAARRPDRADLHGRRASRSRSTSGSGCQPRVAAAVPPAVQAVRDLVARLRPRRSGTTAPRVHSGGHEMIRRFVTTAVLIGAAYVVVTSLPDLARY
jgi:hydrogenase maturation protease